LKVVDYVLLTGDCIWLEVVIVWETHAADELIVWRCAAAPSPPPNVHTRRVPDREKRLNMKHSAAGYCSKGILFLLVGLTNDFVTKPGIQSVCDRKNSEGPRAGRALGNTPSQCRRRRRRMAAYTTLVNQISKLVKLFVQRPEVRSA
jgi:hypothetical protein